MAPESQTGEVAWTAAISALKEQLDIDVTKQNIQSRLKTWNKHYTIISDMLSKSGFSWDYARGMIHVSEKSVWNAWIKEHPEAAPYREKISIENWEDICTLFTQDHGIREGAQNLSESYGNDGSDDHATNIFEDRLLRRSSSSSDSESRKRKQRSSDALHAVLGRMVDCFEKFLSEPPKASTKMVLEKVSKVPDLDRTQLLLAVDLFRHDQIKFETFCDLPDNLKRHWIMIHLNR
ncbi:uncharacterized protein LOC132278803 isoform X2 [Cornus florida]|uniref:uncharacterized protein LOC132278803 isoform X2 n=1 Tax=Cornus florida TaxID=4283 RepID=UPI0028A2A9D8|nr:uncharacterized protein LOC132278803 isoform X2 [Cornus florida]